MTLRLTRNWREGEKAATDLVSFIRSEKFFSKRVFTSLSSLILFESGACLAQNNMAHERL